jgi:hypothetical protein
MRRPAWRFICDQHSLREGNRLIDRIAEASTKVLTIPLPNYFETALRVSIIAVLLSNVQFDLLESINDKH